MRTVTRIVHDISIMLLSMLSIQSGSIEHCEIMPEIKLISIGTSLLANQGIYGDKRTHHVVKHVTKMRIDSFLPMGVSSY